MGKVIHTAVGIDFIEESLKNIKDFFEEITENEYIDKIIKLSITYENL